MTLKAFGVSELWIRDCGCVVLGTRVLRPPTLSPSPLSTLTAALSRWVTPWFSFQCIRSVHSSPSNPPSPVLCAHARAFCLWVCPHLACRRDGTVRPAAFRVRPLSPSVTCPPPVPVTVHVGSSSLPTAEGRPVRAWTTFRFRSPSVRSIDGHMGCFHVWTCCDSRGHERLCPSFCVDIRFRFSWAYAFSALLL